MWFTIGRRFRQTSSPRFGRPWIFRQHDRLLRMMTLEGRAAPSITPHNVAVSNFYQNWNTPR